MSPATTTNKSKTGAKASAAAKARQNQQRKTIIVFGVIVVIGIVAVIAIAAGSGSKGSGTGVVYPNGAEKAAIIDQVTSVPLAASNKVGQGTANPMAKALSKVSGQPPLTKDGKPEMLYIGAEYCPYCATERWAMAVALSRFGTFENLGLTASSAIDTLPNTPTLTFHGSTYTSKYLVFTPVEETTNQPQGTGYKPLDTTTAAQGKLLQELDSGGSIPFITIGNMFTNGTNGATYSPSVLQGKTWLTIAKDLHDPNSDVGQGALGAANQLTAAICKVTGGKPGKVCTSPGVKAITLPS